MWGYNLCAWEQAWMSASCGEDNNSKKKKKKPEDWSAPRWKRMSKAASMWRGNWVRNDRAQRPTLVKSPKLPTAAEQTCHSIFLWREWNIFQGLQTTFLSYWWDNHLPLCRLSYQLWFRIAVSDSQGATSHYYCDIPQTAITIDFLTLQAPPKKNGCMVFSSSPSTYGVKTS